MVDACYFCQRPLGSVFTYHWGNPCHSECVPMDEKDRRIAALRAELEQVKRERDDAKQALRIATNDKLSLLDQLDQAKNARMAQIDYGCDLQRIIEDLCRGGPIREPKTSARHHYNMATETLARTGAVKEEGAELAKAVFGVDLVAHPRATNTVDAHETANVSDNALAEPAGEVEPLSAQIERLASFIMEHVPGEPSQSEGAVDCAIRIIRNSLTTPPASAIREAAERVIWFDWSENDPDAVAAIDGLRAALAGSAE